MDPSWDGRGGGGKGLLAGVCKPGLGSDGRPRGGGCQPRGEGCLGPSGSLGLDLDADLGGKLPSGGGETTWSLDLCE